MDKEKIIEIHEDLDGISGTIKRDPDRINGLNGYLENKVYVIQSVDGGNIKIGYTNN